MGATNYLGCTMCREWVYLGKLTEPDAEKKKLLWAFLSAHQSQSKQLHDLRVVNDYCPDEDLIQTTDDGWISDCQEFESEKEE